MQEIFIKNSIYRKEDISEIINKYHAKESKAPKSSGKY